MSIKYEIITDEQSESCRDLCNELMIFQKTKSKIKPELFDAMNFDTRMVPSIESALKNFIVIVKDNDKAIGYVYANIAPKQSYDNSFATFFDLSSVVSDNVGCLSQLYIKEDYRQKGIGAVLFDMTMKWFAQFNDIDDYFIFVSNGNDAAYRFYKQKGFDFSHEILEGFISVFRCKAPYE